MATADESGTLADCSSQSKMLESFEGQQGRTTSYAYEDGRAFARKKKIWTICIGITFLVISVVGGTLLGWSLRVKDFVGKDMVIPGFSGRQIGALLDVVSVDATAGTITIFWEIVIDTCDPESDATPCTDVNIYLDPSFQVDAQSRQAAPSSNNWQSAAPIFLWSPPVIASTSRDDSNYNKTPLAVFETVLRVVSSPTLGTRSFQDYPFDSYASIIFLAAREATSNSTVGFELFTMGIPVGFKLESDPWFTPNPGSVSATITIKRGSLVKAYALVIVVSVWSITLIFVYATLYSLLGGYPQRVEFVVIPVATLFTVTQLRATMPGAPNGFGAIIDYVALLPCLALMSFCGSVNIALLAFSDPESPRKTVLDMLLLKGARKGYWHLGQEAGVEE
ncbi:hypothetical protein BJV78DRAFT_1354619 [Lactifluus subvellereus]|nr:hypothetical protein BJV78DRAFT_1354619 [Lactifluus subvellereus]